MFDRSERNKGCPVWELAGGSPVRAGDPLQDAVGRLEPQVLCIDMSALNFRGSLVHAYDQRWKLLSSGQRRCIVGEATAQIGKRLIVLRGFGYQRQPLALQLNKPLLPEGAA